jgi:hypothetical protein
MNNREKVMLKVAAKAGPAEYLKDIDDINIETRRNYPLLVGQSLLGTGLGAAIGTGIGRARGKDKGPALGGLVGGVAGAIAMLLLIGKGEEAGYRAAADTDAKYRPNTWKEILNPYALAKNNIIGLTAGQEHFGNALWNLDNAHTALELAHGKTGIPHGKEYTEAGSDIDSFYKKYDVGELPEQGRMIQTLDKLNKAFSILEQKTKETAPRKLPAVLKEKDFAERWVY